MFSEASRCCITCFVNWQLTAGVRTRSVRVQIARRVLVVPGSARQSPHAIARVSREALTVPDKDYAQVSRH
jgi:hypothetical protein